MRWTRSLVSVVASLASFSTGAAMTDETPAEAERGNAPTPRLETPGYSAWGPSFYVWEEDSQQGREWAAELAHGMGSSDGSARPGEPSVLDRPAT